MLKKLIFVNGSPCQDLTIHNAYGGSLGTTGTRSVHFVAIVAAIILLRRFSPHIDIWFTVENAGSMAEIVLEHMLHVLGLPAAKLKDNQGNNIYPHAIRIDAKAWAHARRNRYFIGTASLRVTQPTENIPWEPGCS